MRKRNKRRNAAKTRTQAPKQQTVENKTMDSENQQGDSFESLLFRPMIYKSSGIGRTVDFDHIVIPFMAKEDKIFLIMFMDGCGDPSIYTECCEVDPKKPSETYRDALDLMKECLEMQKLTGTEYYFGKLNKAVKYYLYGMQLFVDKGILAKEQAVKNVEALGFDINDMEHAFWTVGRNMQDARMRRERMFGKKESDLEDDVFKSVVGMLAEMGSSENDQDDDSECECECSGCAEREECGSCGCSECGSECGGYAEHEENDPCESMAAEMDEIIEGDDGDE